MNGWGLKNIDQKSANIVGIALNDSIMPPDSNNDHEESSVIDPCFYEACESAECRDRAALEAHPLSHLSPPLPDFGSPLPPSCPVPCQVSQPPSAGLWWENISYNHRRWRRRPYEAIGYVPIPIPKWYNNSQSLLLQAFGHVRPNQITWLLSSDDNGAYAARRVAGIVSFHREPSNRSITGSISVDGRPASRLNRRLVGVSIVSDPLDPTVNVRRAVHLAGKLGCHPERPPRKDIVAETMRIFDMEPYAEIAPGRFTETDSELMPKPPLGAGVVTLLTAAEAAAADPDYLIVEMPAEIAHDECALIHTCLSRWVAAAEGRGALIIAPSRIARPRPYEHMMIQRSAHTVYCGPANPGLLRDIHHNLGLPAPLKGLEAMCLAGHLADDRIAATRCMRVSWAAWNAAGHQMPSEMIFRGEIEKGKSVLRRELPAPGPEPARYYLPPHDLLHLGPPNPEDEAEYQELLANRAVLPFPELRPKGCVRINNLPLIGFSLDETTSIDPRYLWVTSAKTPATYRCSWGRQFASYFVLEWNTLSAFDAWIDPLLYACWYILLGTIYWFIPFNETGAMNRDGLMITTLITIGGAGTDWGIARSTSSRLPAWHETYSGLAHTSAFFLAHSSLDILRFFIGITVAVNIYYWIAGLQYSAGAFFIHLSVLAAFGFASYWLGMVLGAVFDRRFVPSALGFYISASVGLIQNMSTISVTTTESSAYAITTYFYARYAAAKLSATEQAGRVYYCNPNKPCPFPNGATFDEFYNIINYEWWLTLCILYGWGLFLMGMTLWALTTLHFGHSK